QHVLALEADRPAADPRRPVENAHDGECRDRLAGTGFPDNAEDLAAADVESYPVEHMQHAAARHEVDGEIVDGEQRTVNGRILGSSMSRSASPSRLKVKTVTIRASPGNVAIHHSPEAMKRAPSATRMPHSGVGGRTPRPRKDSPAALSTAQPRLTEAWMTRGEAILGKRKRVRMRRSPEPPTRAAST